MTSVGKTKKKPTQLVLEPWFCWEHLIVQDLRKICLVNHLFLVLVVIIMMYLMITVIRKLTQEKFQSSMVILKSSPGGKPTSTVISWAKVKNYWIFWKMELVTWTLMKKQLLLTERNILLLRRKCTRSITRSEVHLFLLYLVQSIWRWVTNLLQRVQERRSEGLLQLQEAWTFHCWLPWSSEGLIKGQV